MAYQSTTESEEGFMNIRAPFIAKAQSAKLVQPTERTFDDPTRFAQATAVGGAVPRQQVAYAPGSAAIDGERSCRKLDLPAPGRVVDEAFLFCHRSLEWPAAVL